MLPYIAYMDPMGHVQKQQDNALILVLDTWLVGDICHKKRGVISESCRWFRLTRVTALTALEAHGYYHSQSPFPTSSFIILLDRCNSIPSHYTMSLKLGDSRKICESLFNLATSPSSMTLVLCSSWTCGHEENHVELHAMATFKRGILR